MLSRFFFQNKLKVVKDLLIKNGYHNLLIDKVFKTKSNRLKYIKPYGPEKCPVLLILRYVGVKSKQVERDIKNMTKKSTMHPNQELFLHLQLS